VPYGAGHVTCTYPGNFGTATTNLIGVYSVVVDQISPSAIPRVATTSFSVGVTDKLEYQRTETVNIKSRGFNGNEGVFINITRPDGVKVVSKRVNASNGEVTDTWNIPKNAMLGTYTLNITGLSSGKKDIQTFTVKKADLTVTINRQPNDIMRTETTYINFTIKYPNGSDFTSADLGSITVYVYKGTTLVATIPVTTYHSTYGWYASWKAPRDAALGSNYNFTFLPGSIIDKVSPDPNSLAAKCSSNNFEVSAATLSIGRSVIELISPSPTYPKTNRTLTAIARFNITYPDGTFYTSADLKWVNVTIQLDSTDIAKISLTAADFNPATNYWTVQWKIPWNATLGNYTFTVKVNAIADKVSPTPNRGPTALLSSTTFEVRAANLTVAAIYTIPSPNVPRGSWLTVYFTATYPDGSPVTTGTPQITLIRPDGTTETLTATYSAAYARFQASWWLPDYEQLGIWTAKLAACGLVDAADNSGPIAYVTTTFNVTERAITVETIYDYLTIQIKPTLDNVFEEVTSIERKLDEGGSFFVFVNNGFATISGALSDIVNTYLKPILEGVNDIKAKTDTIVWNDVIAIKDTVTTNLDAKISSVLAAIDSAKSEITSAISGLDSKLGAFTGTDTVASLLYDIKGAVSSIEDSLVGVELNVGEILTKLDSETYGLAAIKNAISDLSRSLGTFTGTDTVASLLYDIRSKLEGLTAAQAASGSGSRSFTSSGTVIIYQGSKVGTVTVSIKTAGVYSGEYLIVRYYIDPNNPNIYIEKTVASGIDARGWTDTAAAWKVELAYTWKSGTDVVYWSYSAIYPP
jgi:hypothetical protein